MVLVLQTERLLLRHYEPGDAGFILELLNEPSWRRHIGDRGVRTLEQAEDWIVQRLQAGYAHQGYGFWAVQRREDDALLGMCGLILRDTLPEPDLGYALVPRAWGQGYAREAATACLHHAREPLGMGRVLAITGPDNQRSQRLLTDLGFVLQGLRVLDGEQQPTQVWASDPT